MQEKDKYVYILTSDAPIEKELDLLSDCRQNHIFVGRISLGNEEILELVKNLKLETFQNLDSK